VKGALVHQLMAGFARGDAISHEAMALGKVCRDAGFQSRIYAPAGRIAPDSAGDVCPLSECRPSAEDIVILHYSIESKATDVFLRAAGRRVLLYHNITPAEFYEPYDSEVAGALRRAREALPEVLRAAHAVWADSAFNASELQAMGAARARVFPLIFSPEPLDIPPDPALFSRFAGEWTNILFVGRIAPNKRIEDLIEAFAWFHRNISQSSRLIVAGSDRSAPAYFAMLRMYALELDLDSVLFVRFVSPEGLAACYRSAHLFVTTSLHEGYCLPLLEAMHMGVPVIAHGVGGVPEALGGAGVMYDGLDNRQLAALFAEVLSNPELRSRILESQRQRMRQIYARSVGAEFLSLVSEIAPEG